MGLVDLANISYTTEVRPATREHQCGESCCCSGIRIGMEYVRITSQDGVPFRICMTCHDAWNRLYELHEECGAHKKFVCDFGNLHRAILKAIGEGYLPVSHQLMRWLMRQGYLTAEQLLRELQVLDQGIEVGSWIDPRQRRFAFTFA